VRVNSFLRAGLWHGKVYDLERKMFIIRRLKRNLWRRYSGREGTSGVSWRLSVTSCPPRAPVRVAHQRLAILIYSAGWPPGGRFCRIGVPLGRGKGLVETEKSYQKHADKWKSEQQGVPA
jgi:hypothetical protein